MKLTDQVIDWPTVVSRVLLFSFLWWALTDGTAGSLWIGVPAVISATVVSMALVRQGGLVWREAMGFVPFFLWHSLKRGRGCGVAGVSSGAANHAGTYREYPLRLPPGAKGDPCQYGELVAGYAKRGLCGQVLKVHVLDSLGDLLAELETSEQRVGCMFRSASEDCPWR